jgi:glycerol-3-phosphate dehydrogenase (NAD(P)+)
VIALTIGIALGSGAGDNTIALLLTQGLEEMGQLTKFFGGKSQTVYGLSGFGDLILTCNGSLSKNLHVGKLLGQGNLLACISSQGVLPEGINTVQSVYQILLDQKINAPLMMSTYQFIFEQLSFSAVLAAL